MRSLPSRHTRSDNDPGRRALLTAALLLVLIAPSFGGCGSGETATTASAATEPSGPSTTEGATTTSPADPSTTGTTRPGDVTATSDDRSSRTTVTYADPKTTDTSALGQSGPLAESNALARELKATLKVVNTLIADYEKSGSDPADTTAGRIYALRAQGQALTARRAIVDKQFPLADAALRQCQKLLALAKPLDTSTQAAITQAQDALAQTPAPSQAPDEAASYLDEVIVALRPLVSISGSG